jgi:shikimate dehydrogenase
MQNAGFAALGFNWRYLAFDVHPEQLRAAIEGARIMGFVGLNLTVPHKLLALDLVDVVEEKAKRWGAVNTIVFERREASGAWVPVGQGTNHPAEEVRSRGFNTDADAIVRSLLEAFELTSLRGLSVLLLGAGGAARAAALRLAEEAIATIYLVNRTASKAVALADDMRMAYPAVTVLEGYPDGTVDLVLNATSLGLKAEDPLPIEPARLEACHPRFVYDMIYRPMETRLLRTAKDAGCRVSNGAGMLLYQGARALELWTGQSAPIETMRAALAKNLWGEVYV